MQTKKVTLRVMRSFSEDLRRSIVEDYERGKYTVNELSRLHRVTKSLIYGWIYKYSTYNKKKIVVVEKRESSQFKVKQLEQRINELERIVGQKQLTIDYLERMIELAKEEYQIDLKKNSDTPPSNGSKNRGGRKDVR